MALLKEDGSLDVERINALPLEEYMKEMGTLTQEQVKCKLRFKVCVRFVHPKDTDLWGLDSNAQFPFLLLFTQTHFLKQYL